MGDGDDEVLGGGVKKGGYEMGAFSIALTGMALT